MQLTAKLEQILPAVTGQGANGEWRRQEFILETDGQYPKKVCIMVWGDRINLSQFTPGTMLTVDFDLESRENNGRWYTSARAWKVEVAGSAPQQAAPAYGGAPSYGAPQPTAPVYGAPQVAPQPAAPAYTAPAAPQADPLAAAAADSSDDLPF
ncbi:MAG: DUF3127 domain-containing protein [Candidatus Symbiothrix sp.]|nr:DUF3127 domain-containing protein [Candidatus Symbiothrix sp.]